MNKNEIKLLWQHNLGEPIGNIIKFVKMMLGCI
nr:hypothetical protein [Wolbachia endosymbiont of Brugia pahangi]